MITLSEPHSHLPSLLKSMHKNNSVKTCKAHKFFTNRNITNGTRYNNINMEISKSPHYKNNIHIIVQIYILIVNLMAIDLSKPLFVSISFNILYQNPLILLIMAIFILKILPLRNAPTPSL